jgi:hypothetical protein
MTIEMLKRCIRNTLPIDPVKRITRSPQALTHCLLFSAYKVQYVQACVSMHDNDRRSGIKPISEQ